MTKPRLILEEFLPFQLSVLSNKVSRELARIYETKYGVSLYEWRVMAILGEQPDLSAKRVAEQGVMDKVIVSRAVSKLSKKSMIIISPSKTDRRSTLLKLSDIGMETYLKIQEELLIAEKKILEDIKKDYPSYVTGVVSGLKS